MRGINCKNAGMSGIQLSARAADIVCVAAPQP
jgi:hypothetical protein